MIVGRMPHRAFDHQVFGGAMVKVATAAYPLGWFDHWDDYAAKQRQWVEKAVANGAGLLVFPEYAAMELASFAGPEAALEKQAATRAVSDRVEQMNALHAELAQEFGVHILGGSAPVIEDEITVNRAHFFVPAGEMGFQDKQLMTRFERDEWDVSGASPLRLFDTAVGKIGILICYDSEFPLLARTLIEAGAEILLVPSCTEALAGYWRVRIGAMSRALEGQCVSVMASLTGHQSRLFAVDTTVGAGGVFGPPDTGFPSDGVLAVGEIGQPGWTYADIDLPSIAHVRADGGVLNMTHWVEQAERLPHIEQIPLT